jgi:energy-coupling factor transport system substrate-specific component
MVPVDYTNLHGGKYKYIMEVKDALGRGSNVISVEIVKEKKFYETTVFFILTALLIGRRCYKRLECG